MKATLGDTLQGVQLKQYTKENPAKVVILEASLHEFNDMRTGKPLRKNKVLVDSKELQGWIVLNVTTAKKFVDAWGDEMDNWRGKVALFYTKMVSIGENDRYVIYGESVKV